LSAAIPVDNTLVFLTDSVKPVINNGGTKAALPLVPVQQTAVPVQASGGETTTVPSTSPTQVKPSSAVHAPTKY
ncbi:YbaY family lipoprotein, partial [Salmonella enterica subsp. enterica serovar Infantis]